MRHKIILMLFLFLFLPLSVFADSMLIGRAAPFFKVASGDKKVLTLDDVKGKVAVLFYESKNAIEENRKLKNALNSFYDRQPEAIKKGIVRVGVINCRGVLFRGAWEAALRENSLKEEITIYGDWDGKMAADYHAAEGESNFIIIGKNGTVRYEAAGKIEEKDIAAIEQLLMQLAGEKSKKTD